MYSRYKKGFIKYNKDYQPRNISKHGYNILKRLTIDYITIITKLNPNFKKEYLFIPKRTLTMPKEAVKNNGYDNILNDYILRVNEMIGKYKIIDSMGQGGFGQVVKCQVDNRLVAVKVTKNHRSYLEQSKREIEILMKLKEKDSDKFLQIQDYFIHQHHSCIVFELLSISLSKLLNDQLSGIPKMLIKDIKKIAINLLDTLSLLKDFTIIHTDLKPDNILLKSLDNIYDVKIVDYGSAQFENERPNFIIQTAFYRSPEVIIRHYYNCSIDMWSFGCIIAELYLGKRLFGPIKDHLLLESMIDLLGQYPPSYMIQNGKMSTTYFHIDNTGKYKLNIKTTSNVKQLDELIMDSNQEEDVKDRKALLQFLKNILVFDPTERLTPKEALQHSFLFNNMNESATATTTSTLESQEIMTPIRAHPLKSILKGSEQYKQQSNPRIQQDKTITFSP